MAAKKAPKGTSRNKKSGAKRALKDLPPGSRRAKAVKGGVLKQLGLAAHNYESLTGLISQKVQKVNPSS